MFLRDPALTYDAGGPVGATGSNGPRAAGAAGPVVLALRAHPGGPRPGSGNKSTLCKGPPSCSEHGYRRVESGGESGYGSADQARRYPEGYPVSGTYLLVLSRYILKDILEDILWTCPLDLSAVLILN